MKIFYFFYFFLWHTFYGVYLKEYLVNVLNLVYF